MAANWYVGRDGKRKGPFSAGKLRQMAQSGDLRLNDMVWKEGMPSWVAASTIKGLFSNPEVSSFDSTQGAAGTSLPATSESGSPDPSVIVSPASGGSAPLDYAEFMPRVGAFFLDALFVGCIGGIPSMIIIFVAAGIGAAGGTEEGALVMANLGQACGQLVNIVIGWLYFALQDSSQKQGTFGKQIVGIKVTDLQGNRISFGRATGRYFAKWITGCTCGIGFLMPLWTEKKQTLHDMIAGCLALKK
jgi:uncharacterized RDD family membrane protein YckC